MRHRKEKLRQSGGRADKTDLPPITYARIRKMKRIINKPIRDQRGQALIIVLVMLLVGGLIVAPLLGFMSTGLKTGQMHERKMLESYAADAGWEHALLHIKTGTSEVPGAGDDPWQYTIADINAKQVDVTIEYVEHDTYKVNSTAISSTGENTTIESYIEIKTIFDNAIASGGDIDLKKGSMVTGDIYYEGDFVPPPDLLHDGYTMNGGLEWPSQAENEAFAQIYKDEASANVTTGDLVIPNGPATVELGPLYITRDLIVRKDNTIILKGTIYVDGTIDMDKDAQVTGSGSIIAEGDMYLAKVYGFSTGGNAIIMSLNGDIIFKKEAGTEDIPVVGLIYAPNGGITFDKAAFVTGSVVAQEVFSADKDLTVTFDEVTLPDDLPGGHGSLRVRTFTIK